MRLRFSILSILTIVGLAAGFGVAKEAQAAPPGAATGLYISGQTCGADGLAQAQLNWTPSNLGSQWVDLAVRNDNFSSNFSSGGPYAASQNNVSLTSLVPGTAYYLRVATFANGVWLHSDTLAFTASCSGGTPPPATSFSPPTNTFAVATSSTSARFQWTPGSDNLWFCLDTSTSLNDLLTFSNSWRNHSCFTTSTVIDVSGLSCGTTYYWRVFAWGSTGNGHSQPATVTTSDCQFSPPTSLRTDILSMSSARFSWDRGTNNQFFCVDAAESRDELTGLYGTWRNYGCGTSSTSIEGFGLRCDTTYYWRVYAWGPNSTGYSQISTVSLPSCGFTPPTNLTDDVLSPTSVRLDWNAGTNNRATCVDLAKSVQDLLFFKGTWMNTGCGNTESDLIVRNLDCDTTYYWRVYAIGGGQSGHSGIEQFHTENCDHHDEDNHDNGGDNNGR